ncbi:hypothetical protein I7I50_05755 [Histoplasma capsulatum G186AR]|uniref:Uncharacterized protein n=1 Tax=Ajellomyces capsulatus TaxID=5037 RepID=A0A8H7Z7D6_AJECA|nr:hypothetical protein I7I52_04015 [Histoplasma capsulatum]QSS76338.1 hypothetical protein I7I50_05755 [Histoplasma capsulatum G186AR]
MDRKAEEMRLLHRFIARQNKLAAMKHIGNHEADERRMDPDRESAEVCMPSSRRCRQGRTGKRLGTPETANKMRRAEEFLRHSDLENSVDI